MNQLITFRDGQQVCPLGQGTYQMGRRRNEDSKSARSDKAPTRWGAGATKKYRPCAGALT